MTKHSIHSGQSSKQGQQGAALVIILILMIIATTITIAVANRSTLDVKIAHNDQLGKQALMVAEAGMMETYQLLENKLKSAPFIDARIVNISHDLVNGGTGNDSNPLSAFQNFGGTPGDPTASPPTPATAGTVTFKGKNYRKNLAGVGVYYTRIIDNVDDASMLIDKDEKIWINTIGVVENAERELMAYVKTSENTPGLYGETLMNIETNVDSYTPSYIRSDGTVAPASYGEDQALVGSNTSVVTKSGYTTYGDIESAGTVKLNGDTTGDVDLDVERENFPLENPLSCPAAGSNTGFYNNNALGAGGFTYADGSLISSGDYKSASGGKHGEMNLSGSSAKVYLAEGDYCIDSIKVSGGGQIIINPGITGKVNLYISGDMSFTGNSISNLSADASKFRIISTHPTGADIDFGGGFNATMDLYAPTADVTLSGSGTYFGRIIGNNVDVGNNGGVHVDQSLTLIREFSLQGWREVRN